MKKYRKRVVPEYDMKYKDTDFEYYGVFLEGKVRDIKSVKVDPKRLRKTRLIDNDLYDKIQKINRNTAYFHPAKKANIYYEYDYFRDVVDGLKDSWFKEIKPAMEQIRTPKQAGDATYLDAISTGVFEPDEAETKRFFAQIKRANPYEVAIKTFYAQYILLIGASIETAMIKAISDNGFVGSKFSREILCGYVSGRKPKMDYKEFDNYKYYDKIYKVWNFVKHNNKDVFKKIKDSYPELLINSEEEYTNGVMGINYLKVSEDTLMQMLDDVKKFFDEFCVKVFDEEIIEENWNTERFYVELAKDQIDIIVDPLDLGIL